MNELIKSMLNDAINTENLNTIEIFLNNGMSVTVVKTDDDADIHEQVIIGDDKVTVIRVMMDGCKNTLAIPLEVITFVSTVKECPTMEAE